MSTYRILTEIEIDAPGERVWAVLMDFPSYADWNPFIRSIRGASRPGARLEVRIQPPEGRAMTFRPRVLRADPGREFRWLGHLLLPGVFDGEHHFQLEPIAGGRTRLRQGERFSGLLLPLLRSGLERGVQSGFEQMNQALKVRAEQA